MPYDFFSLFIKNVVVEIDLPLLWDARINYLLGRRKWHFKKEIHPLKSFLPCILFCVLAYFVLTYDVSHPSLIKPSS